MQKRKKRLGGRRTHDTYEAHDVKGIMRGTQENAITSRGTSMLSLSFSQSLVLPTCFPDNGN
jgi:hypothetical protein